MSAPRVTVVMPCFNAASTVEASIGSLQAQTVQDWALLVVDDGSTDDSVSRIRSIQDARIRLIQQPNAGVSAARNRALAEVSTPFVAFLDADDAWLPTALERLLGALAASPDAVLAYSGWEDVYHPPRQRRLHDPPDFEAAGAHKWALLLQRCPWVIHAAITRTEAIRDVGGFDRRFAIAEDFLLWLRVAARGRIVKVPEPLALYHHDDSRPQATRNVLRVVRQTREAQSLFLSEQPRIARMIGRAARRRILFEQSRRCAYDAYWARQLPLAQALFKDCLAAGFYGAKDLKYLLPALLPAAVYQRLVRGRDAAG